MSRPTREAITAYEDLPDYCARPLRALVRSANYGEIRCPYCLTFHRKDCDFMEGLRMLLRSIAPAMYIAAEQAIKGAE